MRREMPNSMYSRTSEYNTSKEKRDLFHWEFFRSQAEASTSENEVYDRPI